jgi:hypothetical protein
MSAASIAAVFSGAVALIGAITALVVALKAKAGATSATIIAADAKLAALKAHARLDGLTVVDRSWTERGGGRHE